MLKGFLFGKNVDLYGGCFCFHWNLLTVFTAFQMTTPVSALLEAISGQCDVGNHLLRSRTWNKTIDNLAPLSRSTSLRSKISPLARKDTQLPASKNLLYKH